MKRNKVVTVSMINVEVDAQGKPIEGDYMKWEAEVVQLFVDGWRMDRGDVQAMLMGKSELMIKCWDDGSSTKDVYNLLW